MAGDANTDGKNRSALGKFWQRRWQLVIPEILCGKNWGEGKQMIYSLRKKCGWQEMWGRGC